MKRFLICLFVAGCLAACGGSQASDEPDTSTKLDKRNKKDAPPVGENKKGKWTGWRWKGKRGNCYYVYKNRCFKRRKQACKAAGCAVARCELDDSAPTKVSCKKKK